MSFVGKALPLKLHIIYDSSAVETYTKIQIERYTNRVPHGVTSLSPFHALIGARTNKGGGIMMTKTVLVFLFIEITNKE